MSSVLLAIEAGDRLREYTASGAVVLDVRESGPPDGVS